MFNACHSDVFNVSLNHDYYCKYGQRVVINDNVTASFSFIDLYPLGKQQDQCKNNMCEYMRVIVINR